jgi:hypothetical protein
MNKVVVVVILSFLSSQIFAQANEGDIEMKKSFWGVKFNQDGKPLKPKEVLRIMEVNPQAHAEFKKAKSNYDAAQVFGFIGGFMVGWPIGTAIGGGDPEWGLAAGGAGFILLSIPFSKGFSKHAKSAIEIYNSDSGTASNRHPYSLQVIPYGAGAKFILKF